MRRRLAHTVALGMLIDPVLPTPIQFADVAAQSQTLHIEHGLLAVVTLVGDPVLLPSSPHRR
jgi:hypothetical protein